MRAEHRTAAAAHALPAGIAVVMAAIFLYGCATVEKLRNHGVLIQPLQPSVAPAPLPPGRQTTIRPDVDCKVPEENFDFMATVQQRLGAEGAARLKTLLSSDFKSSAVSPADRELLSKFSREVLWMPAIVEKWIGELLFLAGHSNIRPMPHDSFEPEWNQATRSLGLLLGIAPKMPFEVRLMLIENGETGSLAGGMVLLDERTVSGATDSSQIDKLTFIAAHELAHIYKRHRAKRIQQLLVDSNTGLELMRKSFEIRQKVADSSQAAGGEFSEMFASLKLGFDTLMLGSAQVEALRKHNAAYEQNQEFEADMCAASMLIRSGVGDPLRGFRMYSSEQQGSPASGAKSGTSKVYESHPPNAEREKRLLEKMKAGGASAAPAQGAAASRPGPSVSPPPPPSRSRRQ